MRILLAALVLALLPASAQAAPQLDRIGTFDSPVYVASPPGDARLFVVERAGRIRVVGKDGATKPGLFADLTAQTTTAGERGLLSIAFPPDHASSGLAYVYLTAPDGDLQIRELRRSASDPDRAEPGAGRLVIEQDHKEFSNHNGGQVAFGPDGLLYAGMGDGGGVNDPHENGQQLTTLLGKIIRIDPRASASGPYGIPGDNPFAGRGDARAEVWAYGLRNPFRFSFDRANGDLWIGDVGQKAREEIDFSPRGQGGGRGANYGWDCFEGSAPAPGAAADCEAPGHAPPLFDLEHEADGVCSITGGVVVRDPGLPTLDGRYVHSDLCDNRIRAARTDGADSTPTGLTAASLVAFGEDGCNRVYPVSLEGPVYRLRDGASTACDLPEAPAAPANGPAPGGGAGGGTPGSTPAADRTPCRLAIRRRGRQRVGALRLAVTASESCTVRAAVHVRGVATVRSPARKLEAGRRSTLKIGVRTPAGARLRRAVRRRSRLAILTVTARDAAGNASSLTRRVRVRR